MLGKIVLVVAVRALRLASLVMFIARNVKPTAVRGMCEDYDAEFKGSNF